MMAKMHKTKTTFLWSCAFIAAYSSALFAEERKLRSVFYTNTDFGNIGHLHNSTNRMNADYQDWITDYGEAEEICLPGAENTFWLQINHRAPERQGTVDAFVVAFLYHSDNQTTGTELQLYRNDNWFTMSQHDANDQLDLLGSYDKEPTDIPDITAVEFVRLNSGRQIESENRLESLSSVIPGFHARLTRSLDEPSSWDRRGIFSEGLHSEWSDSPFRMAARLYRFTTTSKLNSNAPVVVELNRFGAQSVDLYVQSVSEEVRVDFRHRRILFGDNCG